MLIGDQTQDIAAVRCEDQGRECRVIVCYRDKRIEVSAADYFAALCQVRVQLERERLSLFCYGSSVNVRPSGMGRDMALGMQAYRLALGKHARISDLVWIFEMGPDITLATVAEQDAFYEEWLKSEKVWSP